LIWVVKIDWLIIDSGKFVYFVRVIALVSVIFMPNGAVLDYK
jgi:hypothetical protein